MKSNGNRKVGAPRHNRNALRHGLRASQLPADCKYIELSIGQLRRQMENAVVAFRSEVSLRDAALIQSACRHERRSLLLERWFRVGGVVLLSERLAILKDISAATDARDKCLDRLDIGTQEQDAFALLYTRPVASDRDPAIAGETANAVDDDASVGTEDASGDSHQ